MLASLHTGGGAGVGVDAAADFVDTEKIIGMHYDTIPFIKIDHENARREFAAKGIELILMEIGKTLEIGNLNLLCIRKFNIEIETRKGLSICISLSSLK